MDDKQRIPDSGGKTEMTGESVPAGASPVMAQPTEAERRRLRQAQKLRENLQRRKQQLRSRRAGDADEAEGLPGALPGSASTATSSQAGD